MPTVLYVNGYRFFFWMNEHEPIHIHVEKGKCHARVVLVPDIVLSYNHGFKRNEMRTIMDIIICNYEKIIQSWHHAFNK